MSTPQIRKDALQLVRLGHAFAEYDSTLHRRDVFVRTPAIIRGEDTDSTQCLFVGRRGTGKTATSIYLLEKLKRRVHQIIPQNLVADTPVDDVPRFRDTRQIPFHTLVLSFKRTLLLEAVRFWLTEGLCTRNAFPDGLQKIAEGLEDVDFDVRLLDHFDSLLPLTTQARKRDWLLANAQYESVQTSVSECAQDHNLRTTLLIDRIDEAWDGSDEAVICLMALMHACVELNAKQLAARPLLFLRENLFERVRQIDNEFGRIETSVVSLDWTIEQLLEFTVVEPAARREAVENGRDHHRSSLDSWRLVRSRA